MGNSYISKHSYWRENPVGSIYCCDNLISGTNLTLKPTSPLRGKHLEVLWGKSKREELTEYQRKQRLRIKIRVKLTNNAKLNDLLGVERTKTDCTDVGPLISNLQRGQSQRRVTLTNNLGSIYAWAGPLTVH